MEQKYFKPIYLCRYDESNIEAEIILAWHNEKNWTWHYIVHWKGDEFIRGSVKNSHCKAIMHHIRFALIRKGIQIDNITNMRYLNRVVVPNIKNSPYVQWLISNKGKKILEQIEWNMSSQAIKQDTNRQQSMRP